MRNCCEHELTRFISINFNLDHAQSEHTTSLNDLEIQTNQIIKNHGPSVWSLLLRLPRYILFLSSEQVTQKQVFEIAQRI